MNRQADYQYCLVSRKKVTCHVDIDETKTIWNFDSQHHMPFTYTMIGSCDEEPHTYPGNV